MLDDEGEEDDDTEKDPNQGSFVFSSFGTSLSQLTVSCQGRSDWGSFTARIWCILMKTSQERVHYLLACDYLWNRLIG